jgi:hypothetical protein
MLVRSIQCTLAEHGERCIPRCWDGRFYERRGRKDVNKSRLIMQQRRASARLQAARIHREDSQASRRWCRRWCRCRYRRRHRLRHPVVVDVDVDVDVARSVVRKLRISRVNGARTRRHEVDPHERLISPHHDLSCRSYLLSPAFSSLRLN